MKSNFSFLKENKEYELFADACIDAENIASSAPALSVSGSRKELGTQEDYDRTFQDTPLGKLVRRIVKMDHDATMQIFSEYIDEHKWNSQQIAFVRNLIAYVEEHGYIDDMSILLKPPFDRPMPFVRLYSPEDQKRIISIVNDINENATKLVG